MFRSAAIIPKSSITFTDAKSIYTRVFIFRHPLLCFYAARKCLYWISRKRDTQQHSENVLYFCVEVFGSKREGVRLDKKPPTSLVLKFTTIEMGKKYYVQFFYYFSYEMYFVFRQTDNIVSKVYFVFRHNNCLDWKPRILFKT